MYHWVTSWWWKKDDGTAKKPRTEAPVPAPLPSSATLKLTPFVFSPPLEELLNVKKNLRQTPPRAPPVPSSWKTCPFYTRVKSAPTCPPLTPELLSSRCSELKKTLSCVYYTDDIAWNRIEYLLHFAKNMTVTPPSSPDLEVSE